MAQAFAEGAIADLVVGLQEVDEGGGRQVAARLAAQLAVAERRGFALDRRSPRPGSVPAAASARRRSRRSSRRVSPLART